MMILPYQTRQHCWFEKDACKQLMTDLVYVEVTALPFERWNLELRAMQLLPIQKHGATAIVNS
jgi:hypothetical protein